jgi:hypothetical protein
MKAKGSPGRSVRALLLGLVLAAIAGFLLAVPRRGNLEPRRSPEQWFRSPDGRPIVLDSPPR